MSDSTYTYTALSTERSEIRLLILEASDINNPIQCRLSTASLPENPTYTALSYVWSSPAASSGPNPEIILGGHHFPVTPNLHAALRYLRPPSTQESITLWVDAVCINQNDVSERNQQVAMMRDIYARATEVTIWLGEGDEVSVAAFDAFPIVADKASWFWRDEYERRSAERAWIRKNCADFCMAPYSQSPWFTRVWILQELALASSDPTVVCGLKRTSWSTLAAVWQVVARDPVEGLAKLQEEWKAPSGETHFLASTKLDVLNDMRVSTQERSGEPLWRLLIVSRSSAATDPRDHIYGLLGLLDKDALEPGVTPIVVNYNKSCAEVYIDAMKHIFSRGDGPRLLSGLFLPGGQFPAPHIPSLPVSKQKFDLPSWVPDFSRQTVETARQPSGHGFLPPANMTASGAGQGAKNGKVLEDGRTLRVEGLFVDIVDEVVPFDSSLKAVVEGLASLESKAASAREKPVTFPSSIAAHMQRFRANEPLWRVLISNKNIKSGYEAAPASYEDTYSSYFGPGTTEDKLSQARDHSLKPGYELALHASIGRKSFFTTENGFIGTCVPTARKGDAIAIVFGSPSPFVLRPLLGQENVHVLIGTCYTGGVMNGEMVDELYCEDLMDSTTFLIQ